MANNKNSIQVLIADDSMVVREVLKDMIEEETDLNVIGEAHNGREACELCEKLQPDIITMDVMMPVMDGLQAVEHIMAYNPTPILVFSSAVSNKEMNIAFNAIHRGALDVMEKPSDATGNHYDDIRKDLVSKLKMLSNIKVIPHLRGKRRWNKDLSPRPEPAPAPPKPAKPAPVPIARPKRSVTKPVVVVIGASTGGPKALVQIFSQLPKNLPVPILVVQHIAPSFAEGLVEWLNRESEIQVKLAQKGQDIKPGEAYLAPTGKHLVLKNDTLDLHGGEPVNSCIPSVDVMFKSVAESLEGKALAVLLTGMGRDGAQGMKLIHNLKGQTIIQDESTSVIFGMPKAALEVGAVDKILPLDQIAQAIIQSVI